MGILFATGSSGGGLKAATRKIHCPLIKGLHLNPEVKAGISDAVYKRDQRLTTLQHQIGAGLTCLAPSYHLCYKKKEGGIDTPRAAQQSQGNDLQEIEQVNKPAGRLLFFHSEWSKITDDRMLLSLIKGLKLPFLKKPVQEIIPREPKSPSTEKSSIKLC
nr:unnamed protein product [Callosobruchus chinensis]